MENQAGGGQVGPAGTWGRGAIGKRAGVLGAAGQARMPTQARRAATLPVPALQSVPVLQTPRDHAALPRAARAPSLDPSRESRLRHPMWLRGALRVGPMPQAGASRVSEKTSWLFFTVSPWAPPNAPSTLLPTPTPSPQPRPGTPRARHRPRALSTCTPHTIHSTRALLPSWSPKPNLILPGQRPAQGPIQQHPQLCQLPDARRSSLTERRLSFLHLLPQTCCFTRYMQTLCFRHTKIDHAKRVPSEAGEEGVPESHLPTPVWPLALECGAPG